MRKSMWLLSAGLMALSTPAWAQQTDTDGSGAQPTDGATAEAAAVSQDATQTTAEADTSEIVVTATRRNEALSDVPLAVSAVTGQTLQNSGATDIRQLNQLSPSLLVSSTQSEAGAAVARIRGIGTVGDNPGIESSVATFIDGVYRSRTGVGLSELGAIDRIEVLRGPQGTLFGRNASAGLISVITAKPKFDTEVTGEATIGNYDFRRFGIGATGAVTDSIAARIDGVYVTRDGFIEDKISGRRVNDRDRWMLRGQFLYQPNDDLSVRLIADYTKRDEQCCGAVYLPTQDYTLNGSEPSTVVEIIEGLGGTVLDDPKDFDMTITPGRNYASRVKDGGLSAEAVYDFGGAELTSITSYRKNNYVRGQDADFNDLDILYRDDDGGSANRFKTFSQELRLQGTTFNDRLDWLVGGYYANEKLRVLDNLTYGEDYEDFFSCVTAYKIGYALYNSGFTGTSATFPNASLLGDPASANGCINVPTFGALNASVAVPASIKSVLGLLAGFAPGAAGNTGYNAVARQLQLALGLPAQPGLNGVAVDDEYHQTSNNWALFTHNIFSVTDRLKLTVGVRYTHEKKKLEADLKDTNDFCRALYAASLSANPSIAGLAALQTAPCVLPAVPGGEFVDSSSKSEGKFSGTVNLSYKPSDPLLLYASYSRGYKAGGFNLDRSALPRPAFGDPADPAIGMILPTATLDDLKFRPETVDALELGAKFNGRGLDINVALFHQLFHDFQLNAFNGINFVVENINSCKEDLGGADTDGSALTGACDKDDVRAGVRSMGAEVEVFTRPIRDVTFNVGAIYADTSYRKNLVGAEGRPLAPNFFQLPDRTLSNSSEFTATASAGWTPAIGGSGLRGLVYADIRHMQRFNTGSDLDIEKTQNSFQVVNARVGLTGPDHAWAVELWAQNLFDKTYTQVAFDMFGQAYGSGVYSNTSRGVDTGRYARANQLFGSFPGEPRTFGLTLRGKFAPRRAMPVINDAPPPPPPPPPPATQACSDGSVILATDACPVVAPPPAATPERG